jgi:hypothetical protein
MGDLWIADIRSMDRGTSWLNHAYGIERVVSRIVLWCHRLRPDDDARKTSELVVGGRSSGVPLWNLADREQKDSIRIGYSYTKGI